MKKRLVAPLIGLVIAFALPTYAQQKDLADPQTTQKILALIEALNEAQNNNDAAAVAAFSTRDAVIVTESGPVIGRQAIQKYTGSPDSGSTASAFGHRVQDCYSKTLSGLVR